MRVQVGPERYSDMLEVQHTLDHFLSADTQADLVQVDTERYSDMLEVQHTFDHFLAVDTQADLDTVRMEVDKPLLTPSLMIKSRQLRLLAIFLTIW